MKEKKKDKKRLIELLTNILHLIDDNGELSESNRSIFEIKIILIGKLLDKAWNLEKN